VFFDNELRFLEKALQKSHLQTAHILPQTTLSDVLGGAAKQLITDARVRTFSDMFPDIRPHTVYRVTDMYFCRCMFLKLPACEPETILFIGPYLTADITHQQILELGEKLHLSPAQTTALENFYVALPIVREEHHIVALVSCFAEYLWNGEDNYEYAEITHEGTSALLQSDHFQRTDEDDGLQQLHVMEERYKYENELIDAVSKGNLRKAELMMNGFSSLAFKERVPDPLRNMKNYCIIMNTLFRKAAEAGGVHPVYIDRTSSYFAGRIENVHSLSAIPQLMPEILRAYCRLVKQHAAKKYSPVVQKAIFKIESELAGDLSLRAIAAALNVSAGYLSGLFKKETGETLTAFVTEKRVAHAKYLLRSTSLQVQTIAQHCGILDLHYFCKVFKEATGKTPTAYRNQSI